MSSSSTPPDRAELVRESWLAGGGIVLFLGAIKHLGMLVPLVYAHAATAAAVFELYLPIMRIGRRGLTADELGLEATRWDKAREQAGSTLRAAARMVASWRPDLLATLALALIVTVPFAIAHHLWQTILFHRVFHWRVDPRLLETVFAQLVVVALPEELFFRGYLQSRLEKIWPPGTTLASQLFSRAVVVASAVFALAHFIGEYRLDRLGPFFPGLVFGVLFLRTRRLVAPILFHAYCNVLGDVLFAFYR